MTEAKHTPGPWHAQCDDVSRSPGDNGVRFWSIGCPGGPDGSYRGSVCMVFSSQLASGISIDERDANARLIAAAPETTDALRSLLRLFEEIDGGENDDAPELVAARAALAKSQGK